MTSEEKSLGARLQKWHNYCSLTWRYNKYTDCIFQVLRVSKTSLDTGHVLELLCNDSQRLVTGGEYFIQNAIRVLLRSMCAIAWLIYFVNWVFLPGLLFYIFLGLYRFFLTKFDYKQRKKASEFADERLGYLRELFMAMNSIKLNCMEKVFEEKVQHTRW